MTDLTRLAQLGTTDAINELERLTCLVGGRFRFNVAARAAAAAEAEQQPVLSLAELHAFTWLAEGGVTNEELRAVLVGRPFNRASIILKIEQMLNDVNASIGAAFIVPSLEKHRQKLWRRQNPVEQ